MTLDVGTELGPYRIEAPLGVGGMGEVYRATDTRLERTVAVKVLPGHLARDPGLRERFEREARAVSSLSHPHICSLFDVGHQDGIDYLVMEYLEGESLADRLDRGPLPLAEVPRVGAQIADALDAAHRHGIIHRDVKPGNVMLTKAGVKLLDFGLAKVIQPDQPRDLTSLPTIDRPLTEAGTVLGTFLYMPPEQLEGKETDARSDIFGLGAVLYQMVSGRRPFDGKSQASLIAAIMERRPSTLSSVQPLTPPALSRVVERCLEKDPDDRWQSARDIAAELQWIAEGGSRVGVAAPVAARRRTRARLAWTVAAIASAVAVALAAVLLLQPASEPRPVAAELTAPPGTTLRSSGSASGSLTVSPDGRWLTFAARGEGSTEQLWLRPVGGLEARPIPGTEGASFPFWSPDSRHLAFFADGELKRVDLLGSPAVALCKAPGGRPGGWSADGAILFSPTTVTGIHRVPAGGGEPEGVTEVDREAGETTHRFATFLPDGRRFLFLAGAHNEGVRSDANGIWLADLEGGERRKLLTARSSFALSAGHLLYLRDDVLLAQPFDAEAGELTGDPFPLAEGIDYDPAFFGAAFAVSPDGVLAWRSSGAGSETTLHWRSRVDGTLSEPLGEPAYFVQLAVGPDGVTTAAGIRDPETGRQDIWLLELDRGVRTRFSFEVADNENPVWSPDGARIAYSSSLKLKSDLLVKPVDGGESEVLWSHDTIVSPFDWSPDGGNLLAAVEQPSGDGNDIWVVPVDGGEPAPWLATEFDEFQGEYSPDGRFVKYASNESGAMRLYVAPFADSRRKVQVAGDAAFGVWNGETWELILFAGPGSSTQFVNVSVEGDRVHFDRPRPGFDTERVTTGSAVPSGERFLEAMEPEEGEDVPFVLISDWVEVLRGE